MTDTQSLTVADRMQTVVVGTLAGLVPILSILWIMAVPQRLGIRIYPEQIAALMLGFALAVIFWRGRSEKSSARRAIDGLLGLLALALGIHVFIRFPVLSEGAFLHETESMLVGFWVSALVVEALRRVIGWTLIVIFGVLLLYALYGDYMPGPLAGRPQQLGDVLTFLGTDSTATWGQALQIAAFIVVVFVLFGGFLLAVGGGEFFTQLAMRVAGNGPGNTAKVAVVASGMFGSVSGSAVSNVMSTGVMTIPLMKKAGFRNEHAGAIEAVASTGGQLMPPVMGAAAFLMAELLQIPYRDILLAALLPALLYYLSVFVQIDFMARRDRIISLDYEKFSIASVLKRGWIPLIAFTVLLGLIFRSRLRAEEAAIWALAAIIAFGIAAWIARLPHGKLSPADIFRTLSRSGSATCDVILITAAAGMIIGLLTSTGLGFALSLYLLNFGGSSLFLLLVVTGLVGIVLGLGLPTTGVYLLLASLAAPALVQLGIQPLAAHMFVFYFGMLSMITPPIAVAAFAAASIAEAPQIRTALASFRFGWIAYILPFLFIYKPGLLMNGSWLDILYVFGSSTVALALVVGGVLGHALAPLSPALRAVWLPVGLLTIAPLSQIASPAVEFGVSAAGFALLAMHFIANRATAPSASPDVRTRSS